MDNKMKKVRPLIRDEDGDLCWIEPSKPNHSFCWDAKIIRKVGEFELSEGERIITFHSFGAPSLFKPTLEEVVKQIPKKFLVDSWGKEVIAFEILKDDDGLLDAKHVLNSHYHWVFTVLYYESASVNGGLLDDIDPTKRPSSSDSPTKEKEN